MVRCGLFPAHTDGDRDARAFQYRVPLPRDARIGVGHGGHNAGHTGGDQCLGAGASFPGMGTGFEGDIGGCTARSFARLGQGDDLGVGTATRLGPAAPDNHAVPNDHTAHRRVGPAFPHPAPPHRQGQRHKPAIHCGTAHSSGVTGGRNSLTNLSKSSAAWKFL